MILKLDKQQIRTVLEEAYARCKNDTQGKNADYIPYLAGVPATLFGIAACLPDGELLTVGDTDFAFGIESVSKVPTALLAMSQYGADTILRQIGADATGLPFNPLVNAGAIAACSMIRPTGQSDAKWKAIKEFIEALTGSRIAVFDELYRSESETNFNNRSIAWLLRNYGRIYDDPELSLDLYTRQCSLGITARQLAVMAATIASGGVNPITHLKVFDAALTPKITALMATVGFYEHTGDWLFTTGLPAKSGVGGGILAVVPGVMGLAAFAPPLDEAGNSVKAQKALAHIADRLSLGLFNTTHGIVTETAAVPAEA